MKRIAVLVPVHNALAVTRRCIETLRAELACVDAELHVYDDASDAETADYLRSLKDVHYLRNETPRGYAHHLNTLSLWCIANQVHTACVANSDLLFPPNSMQIMLKAAEASWGTWNVNEKPPQSLFLGPALSEAGSGQMADPVLRRINRDEAWAAIQEEQSSNARTKMLSRPIDTVNGACFMFPAAAVLRYGFFDERFGRGSAEEEEWMRRVIKQSGGSKGTYVPAACVWHWKHASFKVADVKSGDLWRGNVAKMKAKWAANENYEHLTHPREWPEYRA